MADEIRDLLQQVLSQIDDPNQGLPQEVFYFVSQLTPLINVDLLIQNKAGQTLLTWRDDKFYGPAWHIPGGIIRFKEKIEDRIAKVADTELGCKVKFDEQPIRVTPLVSSSRNVRGHFISLLYTCELVSQPDTKRQYLGEKPFAGQWSWHDGAPTELLSVHEPFRRFIDVAKPA
jgi:colanic acid biosynthesis protein WcaH